MARHGFREDESANPVTLGTRLREVRDGGRLPPIPERGAMPEKQLNFVTEQPL
ncbi:hypothetical protein [Oscillatoria sp. HE19RPO]|uniref:hypothetical protein n=1 Tax=Oscillatoria sp. HE19RPO TaxID=2954806 RepID=UPI0020C3CE74|nr:hypothetical protein [Oscillatoria sp. HE19RPO]